MAYVNYSGDAHAWDIDSAALRTDFGVSVMDIPNETSTKTVTMEQIDAAIAACEEVENYETETRWAFWTAAKTKMTELLAQLAQE